MHEVSVLHKAVDLTESVALKNNATSVKSMTLLVGELTGYMPSFFEKFFDVVTEGRALFADTRLKIDIESGVAVCNECDELFNVMKNKGVCPSCGSRNKEIVSGQQFMVKNIEVC